MRLKPLRREAVLGEPRRALLASYLAALADLAAPKQAVKVLEDVPRLQVRAWGWGAWRLLVRHSGGTTPAPPASPVQCSNSASRPPLPPAAGLPARH